MPGLQEYNRLFTLELTETNDDHKYVCDKEVSINSGPVAAIWTKTNFGPTDHHHP
jgi:hypothetical protein